MTGLRERKKQETRATILRSAGKLFASEGYQSTTMEDIAAAAGVSVGTLYNYFGNKNTVLVAEVGSQVTDMTENGAVVIADPPPNTVDGIQALMALYLDRFVGLGRDSLRELMAAGFGDSAEVWPELTRLDYLLLDQLEMLLGHYDRAGNLNRDVEIGEAAIHLYSLMATQLIVYVTVADMSQEALQQAVARQIQIAFSGLGAQER